MNELDEVRDLINKRVMSEIRKRIVGYEDQIKQIIICLFASGPELRTHALLEGVPGIAKTELAKTISMILGGEFKRIQGTPDLSPYDIRGGQIYDINKREFITTIGPVFANIVLFDEINRTPPKVQSALLDAMQEGTITIGDTTHKLPEPFMVLATQNPIEHEGTYPLPEAQEDRFMMKIRFGYLSEREERLIVDMGNEERSPIEKIIEIDKILDIRSLIRKNVRIDERQKDYIVGLVRETRPETGSHPLVKNISLGASPRAEIAIEAASRVHAFLAGRTFVMPDDIDEVALPILRHRIRIKQLALEEGQTTLNFVDELIQNITTEVGKKCRS